jgi:hypothetical protein
MPVGEGILKFVAHHRFPNETAQHIMLHLPRLCGCDFFEVIGFPVFRLLLVHVGFADIVQETTDGDAFVLLRRGQNPVGKFPDKQSPQPLVDMQAVIDQSPFSCEVKPGAGWGMKEVRGLQPLQQLLRSRAVYSVPVLL